MASDSLSSKAFVFQESLENGQTMLCLKLAPGEVMENDLVMLREAIVAASVEVPVVLISEHSTLPRLNPQEEGAWIIAAGEYRRAQERFKLQGGVLISLVTGCIKGGIYLIHGMSACHRLVFEDTVIYPALPAETYEAVFGRPYAHPVDASFALERGVVTCVTSADKLAGELLEIVKGDC